MVLWLYVMVTRIITPQGGGTALHVACFNAYSKVVEMLLKHGVDPKAKNNVSTFCFPLAA